jgi:AraC-like DNA-binding protein
MEMNRPQATATWPTGLPAVDSDQFRTTDFDWSPMTRRDVRPPLAERVETPGSLPAPEQNLRIDLTPVEQILRTTKRVALGKYSCPVDHPLFLRGGGPHTCAYIAFHRTSVKLKIGAGDAEVATPNNVSFYNIGETYSREAIGAGGDDCDWIALTPSFLREICASVGYPKDAADAKLFPRSFSPLNPRAFYAQRKLFAMASNPKTAMNSTHIEDCVADLLRIILKDAMGFWREDARMRRHPRYTCHRRRLQIIEDAKMVLAREYWTDLSLADLAQQLYCSAAHLSRIFRGATGFKLSDYRQELRLRKGLFLLEESRLEIGNIAIHLGFASHSHFTSAFHRRFGVNPSDFVKWNSTQLMAA